ncbi:protealysin inhibitor emfourin [Arthrobacter antioxidans]|uniref:protealysin inhibitor emfourin n=1 Tax=Arthrobacter antioxidans TaxID=2895818 RepID=UPI001FFF6551|nr:protealysin inhibitor emfourin [Arthrobacter antioxidans]
MRIVITRSGGVGGLTRTWSLEVGRAEAEQRWLPLAEAEAEAKAGAEGEAEAEGEAAPGAGVRQRDAGPPPPDAARDRFTYRITVGYTEVSVPESRLAEPWRELIERAREATRSTPGPGEGGVPARGTDRSSGVEDGTPEELL